MILITGATGTNGTELIKLLSSRGVPVRAMVRDPKEGHSLGELPGVSLVVGDFDDRASLDQALAGTDKAFLLTPSSERAEAQQLSFIDAAKAAGVKHLVLFSQFASTVDSPVRFLRYHAVAEEAARRSGMAWTFLRPNLFMQGVLLFKDMIAATASFSVSAGDARVSIVDVRDIAAAAAEALTEPGHEGRIYDLTGPEALTHTQMAEQLSAAIGREIRFVDVPEEAMAQAMLGIGMPAWQVEGLVEDYAHYRRGEAAVVCSGVQDATGNPPRSFGVFACDHAAMFAA